MKTPINRILSWGIVLGLYSNLTGLLGNRVWLGAEWDRSRNWVTTTLETPYPRLVREAVSLSFDFLHCLILLWLFSQLARRTTASALGLVVIFWAATVGVVYAVMVNSRFLPWELATKAALMGLVLWLPFALLFPRIFPAVNASAEQ